METRTKFKSLADLEAEALRHAAVCRDRVQSMADMVYHGDGFMDLAPSGLFDETESVDMEEHAYTQLAQRLQAPRPTWLRDAKRCPQDLEQTIVQRLLTHRANDQKNLLLRMRDTDAGANVRAVLSDQYTPFDNHDFVTMVADALDGLGDGLDVKVARSYVGDTMRAYVLIGGITFNLDNPDNDGGGLHPGIYLSNSEIGTGSVRVTAGLWRDVCTNGAIYGWDAEWNKALTHRHYTKNAFRAVIADNVAAALAMSQEAAEKFVASFSVPVNKNRVQSIIDQWSADGVTVRSRERWEDFTQASAADYNRDGVRLFDVVNGLTRAAQFTDSQEEAELMERTAGDLLAHLAPSQGND